MNNILTGLGLALVLALCAALVGPLFVDWGAYRGDFAREAGRLIGARAQVTGDVEVRLLPTPYARFHGLSAGEGGRRLSVDEVEIELAFTSLLKGEFKADRLLLRKPRLDIEISEDGTVKTPFTGALPKAEADIVSFDGAQIEGGAIFVTSPSGRYAIEDIVGTAEAASLKGPLKFDGSGRIAGARAALRLATSRIEPSGVLRFKLEAAPQGRPETISFDGALATAALPSVEGQLAIARPAGRGDASADPWRATATLKGDARSIAVDALDIVYGPDDRAARLSGSGTLTLGGEPRFDLALAGKQVDLDRLAEDADPTPAGRLAALAPRFFGLARPAFGGRVTLDLGAAIIGGDVAQDISAAFLARPDGWRVERFKAALPGSSKAEISGAVAFGGGGPGFAGRIDFGAADFVGFRRWVTGEGSQGAGQVRRVALKGDVTARLDAVTIENADLDVEGAHSRGRLAWRSAEETRGRPSVEAALVSERLDLDGLGFDRGFASGLGHGGFDVALMIDARTLVFAGMTMSGFALDGTLDGNALQLKRLNVADAEGASVSGAGRLSLGDGAGDGELKLSAAADSPAPVLALARAAAAPVGLYAAIERSAPALAPFRLAIDLVTDPGGARLSAKGQAAGGTLDVAVASSALSLDADAEIKATLSSPDGGALAALAGVAVNPIAGASGGSVSLAFSGAPRKGMTGEARFLALGLDLGFKGRAAFRQDGANADGNLTLKSPDLGAGLEALGRVTAGVMPPMPTDLAAKARLASGEIRLDAISGSLAGRRIAGELSIDSDARKGFSGDISIDRASVAELAALAFGPEALAPSDDRRSVWPVAAFGPSPLQGLIGRIDVAAGELALPGGSVARDARFALAAKPNAVAVETFAAELYAGRLTGSLSASRQNAEASATVELALKGARAEQAIGTAQPVTGSLDVALQAQATGRSLAGLIASLNGAGSITLTNGAVAGLDPAAADRVEPQVEAGLALDAARIGSAVDVGLGAAALPVERATLPFTIAGNTLRSGALDAASPVGRLQGAATLDLSRLLLDADFTLAPLRRDAPEVGVAFEGPLASPRRRVDATGLVNWLSVRAVERETRRIDAMEAEMRERTRIAREKADAVRAARAEEARKRAEEQKKLDAERKADAEKKRRDAEIRALLESTPKLGSKPDNALPPPMVITPPVR